MDEYATMCRQQLEQLCDDLRIHAQVIIVRMDRKILAQAAGPVPKVNSAGDLSEVTVQLSTEVSSNRQQQGDMNHMDLGAGDFGNSNESSRSQNAISFIPLSMKYLRSINGLLHAATSPEWDATWMAEKKKSTTTWISQTGPSAAYGAGAQSNQGPSANATHVNFLYLPVPPTLCNHYTPYLHQLQTLTARPSEPPHASAIQCVLLHSPQSVVTL